MLLGGSGNCAQRMGELTVFDIAPSAPRLALLLLEFYFVAGHLTKWRYRMKREIKR
jgi:hypothetical protein